MIQITKAVISGTRETDIGFGWLDMRSDLEQEDCDALIIMDCCYATVAGLEESELEAASNPIFNFTMVLADTLESAGGRPTTVAQIHAAMVSGVKHHGLHVSLVHADLGRRSIMLARLGQARVRLDFCPTSTIRRWTRRNRIASCPATSQAALRRSTSRPEPRASLVPIHRFYCCQCPLRCSVVSTGSDHTDFANISERRIV